MATLIYDKQLEVDARHPPVLVEVVDDDDVSDEHYHIAEYFYPFECDRIHSSLRSPMATTTTMATTVPLGAIDGLQCDSCGIGTREFIHCEFSPPRCDNWCCSRGGPPCYGGSYHQYCTCVEGDALQKGNDEICPRIDVSATSFPLTTETRVDHVVP